MFRAGFLLWLPCISLQDLKATVTLIAPPTSGLKLVCWKRECEFITPEGGIQGQSFKNPEQAVLSPPVTFIKLQCMPTHA